MTRNFDSIKDKVIIKLVQVDESCNLLSKRPHIRFLDMAVVFYLILDRNDPVQVIAINNDDLNVWNTTTIELYQRAKINTPKLLQPRIKSVYELISESEAMQIDVLDTYWILYDRCLNNFAKKYSSDLILFPLSKYDLMIMLTKEDMKYLKYENMLEIVKSNGNVIPEGSRLSNSIYKYSENTEQISIIEKRDLYY